MDTVSHLFDGMWWLLSDNRLFPFLYNKTRLPPNLWDELSQISFEKSVEKKRMIPPYP